MGKVEDCYECNGTGRFYNDDTEEYEGMCHFCNGSGKTVDEYCDDPEDPDYVDDY